MPITPDSAEEAAAVFEEAVDDAEEEAMSFADQIEDYIVAKPVKSMLIALVTGFVVSRIAF